jgi:hypothetical protein
LTHLEVNSQHNFALNDGKDWTDGVFEPELGGDAEWKLPISAHLSMP